LSKRVERVNSLLEHELSKILLKDFDFSPEVLVTLTRVEATPNLIEAKVYVSVFPDEKADKIIETLNKGIYSIQQKINKLLKMRPVPKIRFVKEEQIAEAAKIEGILEKLKNEEKD
jgi:ribosome-binding factor A